MQVVILAAGKGTRMGGLTKEVPKPMLSIKNKPILAYKIETLPEEIDEVVLVVGYLAHAITNYFGDSYDGKKMTYVIDENFSGTAGALFAAKDVLKEEFIVMMGDDLYAKDDVKKIMAHQIAFLGYEVDQPSQFGIIKTDNEGKALEIVEKPNIIGTAFANTGLYKLTDEIFSYPMVSLGNGEFGLPQTLMQMKDKHEIVVEKASSWFPIGTPEDLQKAEDIIETFI